MALIIISLVGLIIIFSISFFALGQDVAHRKADKVLATFEFTEIPTKSKEMFRVRMHGTRMEGGFYCIIIAAIFIPLLWGGLEEYRDKVIDDYRSNKIVEQVSYKYKSIDGEKILTDSTFVYIRND